MPEPTQDEFSQAMRELGQLAVQSIAEAVSRVVRPQEAAERRPTVVQSPSVVHTGVPEGSDAEAAARLFEELRRSAQRREARRQAKIAQREREERLAASRAVEDRLRSDWREAAWRGAAFQRGRFQGEAEARAERAVELTRSELLQVASYLADHAQRLQHREEDTGAAPPPCRHCKVKALADRALLAGAARA
jgi:hypothetical protein